MQYQITLILIEYNYIELTHFSVLNVSKLVNEHWSTNILANVINKGH